MFTINGVALNKCSTSELEAERDAGQELRRGGCISSDGWAKLTAIEEELMGRYYGDVRPQKKSFLGRW